MFVTSHTLHGSHQTEHIEAFGDGPNPVVEGTGCAVGELKMIFEGRDPPSAKPTNEEAVVISEEDGAAALGI